ncbi:class I SAM-dependent methyltransferase [Saliterribacillus persicus]|uniref:Methyltransferase family protein n=1 Tax=Saliterribacillus persicus TaxID=930114 RepID=A0A368X8L8_9BACI|nr:methyltransferase domain-containing protein [Saliterribacillus persicus]RCW63338.1 methyltransferase family protein [Saliterribacillus persicus]
MERQVTNIVPIQGSIEALPLPDGSIDIVIASLVLHEIQPLTPLLQQMKYTLKNKGYLICLELEAKGSSEKAPRITLEKMEQEMKEAGFKVTEKYFPAKSLYMLIAQKTD